MTTTAKKTPTKNGASPKPSAAPGTAPSANAGVMGEREPDASPQVSPSRPTDGKDGGPAASDAPGRPPVTLGSLRTRAALVLAEDGIYPAVPEDLYHAHPALSSSGARQLLPPSCPARFRWEQDNGRPPKRHFDQGHAAHARVLGAGADVVVVQKVTTDKTKVDADTYQTKSAQQHRDEIRAEGNVPILRHELEDVDGMAAAIREHPVASRLFDPELGGAPEVSLVWTDEVHGVRRRARLDWMPPVLPDGRMIIPDYKTTTAADRWSIAKSVRSYGYFQQDPWYRDAIVALGIHPSPAFLFVFQEKTPPYLVTVIQLDGPAVEAGRVLNDRALQVFAECSATGEWPAHADDIVPVSLPPYVVNDLLDW
jgi:hypothetical protein